jgi:hypothetical protein
MRRRYPHCNKIDGPFAPRLITMLKSPAYRALSLSAHRILARLEIELYQHGGEDNGKLIVTYDHFVEHGIDRDAIAPALRELEALGFIEIPERGRAGNWHEPSKYRLTYRPVGRARPTHEWGHVQTMEQAQAIARAARKTEAENLELQSGKTGVSGPENPDQKTAFSGPENPDYGLVRKTPTPSISRVHVSMADTGLPPKARLREPAVNGVEHEPTATVPLDVQEFDRLRSEPAPWSTPTVEEIVPGTLPTKPAARTNGAQPQADVGPEPIATVPSDDPIGSRACAVCEKSAPTRAVSAPDPAPAEQVEIAPQANEMEAALPAEDQSVRHRDQVMRAIEALCPDHTDARRREAVSDAGRYLARWGAQAQGCGWTSTQQAALICQMRGREVTALSPNQASIGNKVIYRFQL